MSSTEQSDIRGVLISYGGGKILLPNAGIAEVITFSEPEPIAGAPAWFFGLVRWRGWRVPVMSFERLVSPGAAVNASGAKMPVLKALSGNPKMPYFAMVAQGFPRLVTVSKNALKVDRDNRQTLPAVQAWVQLGEEQAAVPDLMALEMMISKVVEKAA